MSVLNSLRVLRTACLRAPASTAPVSWHALRGRNPTYLSFHSPRMSSLFTLSGPQSLCRSSCSQLQLGPLYLPLPAGSDRITRTQAASFSLNHISRATWRDQKKPPPPPRFKGKPVSGLRARIDRMNGFYIIGGFLGIYGLVFLAWTAAKGRAVSPPRFLCCHR